MYVALQWLTFQIWIVMNDVDEKDNEFLFFISKKKKMKLVA
jgi:hypothetical protein